MRGSHDETLIVEIARALEQEGSRFAVIGAMALLAHNAARVTLDLDLLVTDARLLRMDWKQKLSPDIDIEVRLGDHDDPLAGVITFSRQGETDVDLVVGRWKWQQHAIERARAVPLAGISLPVVSAADLLVLKIDAGGYRDLTDAELLIERRGPELFAEVRELLPSLPERLRTSVLRFLSERDATA